MREVLFKKREGREYSAVISNAIQPSLFAPLTLASRSDPEHCVLHVRRGVDQFSMVR